MPLTLDEIERRKALIPGPKPQEKLENYRRESYAVWEITLKCNLACQHCGSRAGDSRLQELSTPEALDLVAQMAHVGIQEVTLIGGEAFLRPDWLEIARAIDQHGMLCTMTTGGYGLSDELALRMLEAGIAGVSVSVDGLEETHDRLRGKKGSWRQCFKTIENLRKVGMPVSTNTQVNRLSAPEMPQLYEILHDAGSQAWQIQLTVPMGNAADHAELLLQPVEILPMYKMLARIAYRANREGLRVLAGNNIGYFSPYDTIVREYFFQVGSIWMGCQAGMKALGIEADGAIKGCPSLPTKPYTGGNYRLHSLDELLDTPELTFNLAAGTPEGTDHLWGFCQQCEHAELCRGGCSWTAHVFFDRRGNNPYCHHRALTQKERGLRERVYLKTPAAGEPFDNGVFELIEEPFDANWPDEDLLQFTEDKIVWPPSFEQWPLPPF